MRAYTFFGLVLLGAVAVVIAPATIQGQFGGGKFGGKGGGGPFGGNPFGGGKGGGGPGGFMPQDPNSQFDYYAKGRPFFLVMETRMLRDPLMQYAQQKGITNGQITRQQFLEFSEERAKAGGGSGFPPQRSMGGPPSPGMNMPAPQNPDMINQWAEADFRRKDSNGDGKLNSDEMPATLKGNLAKWDTNNDGFIEPSEYRAYFAARMNGSDQEGQPAQVATLIVEEEDWDRKPVVLRAGKLPKEGMPTWFKELDIDSDGQIALYEWRKAGKRLDDFEDWDADDDGFITPEEAMRHHAVLVKSEPKGSPGAMGMLAAADRNQGEGERRPGFGFGGGKDNKNGKKGNRPPGGENPGGRFQFGPPGGGENPGGRPQFNRPEGGTGMNGLFQNFFNKGKKGQPQP